MRETDIAIANADSRDQLTASRARVVPAGDDARPTHRQDRLALASSENPEPADFLDDWTRRRELRRPPATAWLKERFVE